MFERLISLFTHGHTPEPLPEPDADLALGALLVRMAKADHQYLFEEIQQIDKILAAKHDISVVAAMKMRATCEELEKLAPETESFVQLIRAATPKARREAVISALEDVAKADGVRHDEEQQMLEQVRALMGV